MINYTDIISIDTAKRFGKPCIKGPRVSVYDVLGWMASGMDVKDIIADYPEISKEQIMACLSYAAEREHKIRIAS
jgi:uncharacterized protein (DUF433 family)